MNEDIAKVLSNAKRLLNTSSDRLEEVSGAVLGFVETVTQITDFLAEEIDDLLEAAPVEEEQPSRTDKIQYLREVYKGRDSIWDYAFLVDAYKDEEIDLIYRQVKDGMKYRTK